MTIPLVCVTLAYLLVLASKLPVALAMHQADGYDNHHPRQQQAALVGWGKRAVAAHHNAFEAFAPFAAAVLVADAGKGDPTWAAGLSVAFLVARSAYNALYIADLALLRPAVVGLAAGCCFGLFALAFLG